MPSFNFSKDIRLGDVLNIAGFLVAAAAAYSAFEVRMTKLEDRQMAQADIVREARLVQAEVIRELKENVREISLDVKSNTQALRTIEGKLARRM